MVQIEKGLSESSHGSFMQEIFAMVLQQNKNFPKELYSLLLNDNFDSEVETSQFLKDGRKRFEFLNDFCPELINVIFAAVTKAIGKVVPEEQVALILARKQTLTKLIRNENN